MKRTVIVNPNSGSVSPEVLDALRTAFASDSDGDVQETESADDVATYTRQAVEAGADQIVIVGGDGTVGAMFHHAAELPQGPTFAVLPGGTGNDFARGLPIALDMQQAIETVLRGETCDIDRVRVDVGGDTVRRFVHMAIGGFDSRSREQLEARFKACWGIFGHVAAAAEGMATITVHETTAQFETLDGNTEEIKTDATAIVIANSRYMSAGVEIAPQAELDDGLVDVIICKAGTTAELAMLGSMIAAGAHADSELIEYRQARRVTIQTEPPMPFHIDDHFVTESAVTFTVEPQAVRITHDPALRQRFRKEPQGS